MPSVGRLLSYMGYLSYLASPIQGLALRSQSPPLLDTRAEPFQNWLVHTGSTFGEESNGVWQLIDATGDGVPDLAYIKTSSTGTGRVEVHIASSSSNFQTRIFEAGTTFGLENDGTWLLVPPRNQQPKKGKNHNANALVLPDLAFIKTSNTPSGYVEVHIASGASQYQTRTVETPTPFRNEDQGVWRLYDYDGDGIPDLVYIKTRNTGTGTVEVHVASGRSTYSQFILQTGTAFGLEENGSWYLAPYTARGAADLVYVKNARTGTGRVEVHVASAASRYQAPVFSGGSAFAQESNGVWGVVDYNRDGVLDLTYIKDRLTGTRSVEVHVAAG